MSDALATALTAFKANVEDFLVRTGMPASRFGLVACRDKNFVFDLRKGKRQFLPSTMSKVEKFMSEYPERDPAQANVSASADPSDGQGEPARSVTRAPQRERAA